VSYHGSGKHHAVVKGINRIGRIWTDGDQRDPCDYRLYDAQDGQTKNDHAQAMLHEAHPRGLVPKYGLFDSRYASIPNLKYVRSKQWKFLTRMKVNRQVRLNRQPAKAVSPMPISAHGTVVWLPEFGEVKVFRVVLPKRGPGALADQ
jgi:putative transposase